LNGWIIHKKALGENHEVKRLVEEFEKREIKIRVVNPQDVDIFVDRDDRKSIIVDGVPRKLPDFVLPRTGSGTTYFIKAIIRHLERLGVVLINGSDAIDNVKDKLYSQQILGQSNLPVPKTMLVKHPINVKLVESNIKYPMIVKTLSGSYGSGVFMVEDRKQFRQLMKMAELSNARYNIIIQECVEDSLGRDLRVLVVNGKVVGCMMRQSIDGDFRANITRGGEAIPYQIDEDIEWIGGECARLLDLDIAGVDLLFDKGKYVNGLVWDKLFKGYREYYMEMIDSLEDDRVRLQLKIDELTNGVQLDGLDVTVTMYHPVKHQTDRTPNILADGTKITIHKASEYKYVAVSRNLLKRWGGWLDYGDFIILTGTDGKDGVYQVKDTMNKRFVNRIDILESPGVKPYKFVDAKIKKANLNEDIKFITN